MCLFVCIRVYACVCDFITVTKFVRFGIGNRNVSPPYFDKHLYETEVEENVELQTTILTVNVHDHNESK